MNIQMIPLNALVLSSANVRKTGSKIGIDELASSIAAHGLLHNLQVRPVADDRYQVVAGGRRLGAFGEQQLTAIRCGPAAIKRYIRYNSAFCLELQCDLAEGAAPLSKAICAPSDDTQYSRDSLNGAALHRVRRCQRLGND